MGKIYKKRYTKRKLKRGGMLAAARAVGRAIGRCFGPACGSGSMPVAPLRPAAPSSVPAAPPTVSNYSSDPNINALFNAIENKNISEVERLITITPSLVNAVDNHGSTALINACALDTTERIPHLLLDKGANPNKADSAGETSLTTAVFMGLLNVVNKLIQKGADVNYEHPTTKESVLFTAARRVKGTEYNSSDGDPRYKGKKHDANTVEILRALIRAGATSNPTTSPMNNFSPAGLIARYRGGKRSRTKRRRSRR
jgi:hypothetical protein